MGGMRRGLRGRCAALPANEPPRARARGRIPARSFYASKIILRVVHVSRRPWITCVWAHVLRFQPMPALCAIRCCSSVHPRCQSCHRSLFVPQALFALIAFAASAYVQSKGHVEPRINFMVFTGVTAWLLSMFYAIVSCSEGLQRTFW